MEKSLLIRSLKHWCDLIWEYNSSIDKIYVHCDKLTAKIENNWYDPTELVQILVRDFGFEISRSEKRISAEYMQSFVDNKVRQEEFQLWFYHSKGNLKWYNIRIEKMSENTWLITGQNMYDEINEKSMYRALRSTFDSIMSLNVESQSYIVTYTTTPLIGAVKEYDYAESVTNYMNRHVVDDNKAQILRDLQLDTIVKKLEEQEEYSVFFTVREKGGVISYKRVIHTYYDASHRLITITMMDISNVVARYEKQLMKIRRENSIDALTGVYNRNYYEKNIQGGKLSGYVAMIDLDDLKHCNDNFGHKAGDAALKKLASIIRRVIRPEDRVIRFGGDEFLLLMDNCTEEQFEDTLVNIQRRANNAAVPEYDGLSLSVSIGGVRANGQSSSDSVMRADRLMYMAKTQKNLVVTERLALRDEENRIAQFDKDGIRQQVLVVDSSAQNRTTLHELLRDDFRVVEAESGQECLQFIKDLGSGISLILLAMEMPEMDGFEVLSEMSRMGYLDDIPVIMIASSDSADTVRKIYAMGAADYITQPFNAQVVFRRVSNIIMLKARMRHLADMVNRQVVAAANQQQLMVDLLSHIIGFRSGECSTHFANISRLSSLLLKALVKHTHLYRLNDEACDMISTAAIFHDIGKIGISEDILYKPGKLTAEEFEIMKTHTLIGQQIIQSMDGYNDEPMLLMAAQVCRWHHERYDGGGYPDGLVGDDIPISAQVVSIADVYDALVSERVYKPAYTPQQAIQMILNGECGAFNPLLIKCLLEVSDQFSAVESTPPPQNLTTHPGGSIPRVPYSPISKS